jgi:hypothetical protein
VGGRAVLTRFAAYDSRQPIFQKGDSFLDSGRWPALPPDGVREIRRVQPDQEITIPFSAFGTDGHDINGILFAAGGSPGAFQFAIDNVRLE